MLAGLSAVFVVPLVVAVAVLHGRHWLPIADLAQMEMRIRDVGFDHPPLLGLPGRIEGYGQVGSHPGPLGFYLLAPLYRLGGADSWALQTACITLSTVAAVLVVWIAYRRGGLPFAALATVALAVLVHAYDIRILATPWNPFLPVVWWLVFLLAVWSVWCDDLPMLPLAVFAGALCLQTHVPYALLVAGLLVPTGVWLVVRLVRGGPDRRLLTWVGVSAALLAVVFLPPLIEQATNDPGNLAILVENFRHPYAERIPATGALDRWLAHLDVVKLVRGSAETLPNLDDPGHLDLGQRVPGLVLLVAWAASAWVAWRRPDRDGPLLRLHLLVAAAQLLGLVAISRIFGQPWSYLMLWAWGTTALTVLAIVWTFLQVLPRPRAAWALPAVTAAAVLVSGVVLTRDASSIEMDDEELAGAVDHVSRRIEARLADDPAGCGDDCRYLVTFTDPVNLVSPTFGVQVDLERHGYDVGINPYYRVGVRDHRLMEPDEADAEIQVAYGEEAIAQWRAMPEAEELGSADATVGGPVAAFLVIPPLRLPSS